MNFHIQPGDGATQSRLHPKHVLSDPPYPLSMLLGSLRPITFTIIELVDYNEEFDERTKPIDTAQCDSASFQWVAVPNWWWILQISVLARASVCLFVMLSHLKYWANCHELLHIPCQGYRKGQRAPLIQKSTIYEEYFILN